MPAFHQHLGYRLDLTRIEDVTLRLQLRDDARGIAEGEDFTDTVLREVFDDLASKGPGLVFQLLVHVPDYSSYAVWSLRDGKTAQSDLGWRGENTGIVPSDDVEDYAELPLDDDEVEAWETEVERLGGEPEGEAFPSWWEDAFQLRAAIDYLAPRLDEKVEVIVQTDDGSMFVQVGGGAASVEKLLPVSKEPSEQELVDALYQGKHIELGVDALEQPDGEQPLTKGHPKARLAAVERFAPQRSRDDLPRVLAALRDPINTDDASVPVRKAMFGFLMWFDEPDAWDVVLAGLRSEHEEVKGTINYCLWRLEGLKAQRPTELAAAQEG